jgi:Lon-like protease
VVGRIVAVAGLVAMLVGGWLFARGEVPCEVLAVQPSCEVAVLPGPSEDTLPLVTIGGAEAFETDGQLRLTTIAVQDHLGLRDWLRARTSRTIDAVPRETIYPAGADAEEVAETNAVLMADSQLVATIAGLTASGYTLTGEGALVAGIQDDAVTDDLEAGDVIVGVDGEAVTDSRDVVDAVQASDPGATLEFAVESDGAPREVDVRLGRSDDDPPVPYVGVLLTTELDLPVEVSIDSGEIGGPSAGLLFALSIVELLGAEDLTDGRIVAGTGTVDRDGRVGPVGGIRQKVAGATTPASGGDPAAVFLVPRDNLAEARRAPVDRDILLVPVDTLDDAIDALGALRSGRDPQDAVVLAAGGW